MHVLIVEARFYEDIADELVAGAVATLAQAGASYERLSVPGAFEIPGTIAMALAGGGQRPFDAFIALGCVIRGETTHYDYVCGATARGLMDLAVRQRAAIGYGILTVENHDQAWERAAVAHKNKGRNAAEAALRMAELNEHFGTASA